MVFLLMMSSKLVGRLTVVLPVQVVVAADDSGIVPEFVEAFPAEDTMLDFQAASQIHFHLVQVFPG